MVNPAGAGAGGGDCRLAGEEEAQSSRCPATRRRTCLMANVRRAVRGKAATSDELQKRPTVSTCEICLNSDINGQVLRDRAPRRC